MAATQRWTTADLDLFPDTLEDKRYEIIDGELYVSRQPSVEHQFSATQVTYVLQEWNERTGAGIALGAPGIIFVDDDNVAPDAIWATRETLRRALRADGKLHSAPELVAEVLSPGETNERRDREAKLGLYSRQGVREYWLLNAQERKVEVFRRYEATLRLAETLFEQDVLQSPLLPGFACPVGRLFLPRDITPSPNDT
jgi:Uma2 family endonuclease